LSQTLDLTQFFEIPLYEGRRTRELETLGSFQPARRRRWWQRVWYCKGAPAVAPGLGLLKASRGGGTLPLWD